MRYVEALKGGRPRTSERITVSMCSYAGRAAVLPHAVASLADQVDAVNVYLNDIPQIPQELTRPKVNVLLSRDASGDLKSNGKFYWMGKLEPGYYLFADDDIIYPPNYAKVLINAIEAFGRRAVVCVHGSILPQQITSYYNSKTTLDFRAGQRDCRRVHCPGTGTMAFHSSLLTFHCADLVHPNMDDILVGVLCKQKGIPIYAVKRRDEWLVSALHSTTGSIFDEHRDNDALQTHLIKMHSPWPDLSQGGIAK